MLIFIVVHIYVYMNITQSNDKKTVNAKKKLNPSLSFTMSEMEQVSMLTLVNGTIYTIVICYMLYRLYPM